MIRLFKNCKIVKANLKWRLNDNLQTSYDRVAINTHWLNWCVGCAQKVAIESRDKLQLCRLHFACAARENFLASASDQRDGSWAQGQARANLLAAPNPSLSGWERASVRNHPSNTHTLTRLTSFSHFGRSVDHLHSHERAHVEPICILWRWQTKAGLALPERLLAKWFPVTRTRARE